MDEDQSIPESMCWYTDADRDNQLIRFVEASSHLGVLFTERPYYGAAEYVAIAELAESLRQRARTHAELKELAKRVPSRPAWLDPRNTSWNMPRDSWMDDVSEAHARLGCATLELRALGTF